MILLYSLIRNFHCRLNINLTLNDIENLHECLWWPGSSCTSFNSSASFWCSISSAHATTNTHNKVEIKYNFILQEKTKMILLMWKEKKKGMSVLYISRKNYFCINVFTFLSWLEPASNKMVVCTAVFISFQDFLNEPHLSANAATIIFVTLRNNSLFNRPDVSLIKRVEFVLQTMLCLIGF